MQFLHTTSLHRHWRTTVDRLSIPHHHSLARHPTPLGISVCFSWATGLKVPLLQLALLIFSCTLSSVSPGHSGSALRAAMFWIRRLVETMYFFFIYSCWCLRTTIFRSTLTSTFSWYAQLWLSLLSLCLAQAKDGCMWDNSFRHSAALQMSYIRL